MIQRRGCATYFQRKLSRTVCREEGLPVRREWRPYSGGEVEVQEFPFYSVDVSLCATEGFGDNRGGTPQILVE